jgi:hypothetical protein
VIAYVKPTATMATIRMMTRVKAATVTAMMAATMTIRAMLAMARVAMTRVMPMTAPTKMTGTVTMMTTVA